MLIAFASHQCDPLFFFSLFPSFLAANRRRKYSNDAAQLGRTESLQWRLKQPLYGPCVTLEHSSQPAGISCMLVFADGGGNTGEPGEKPSKQRREPTQTQPTYGVGSGNRTSGTLGGGECSHHYASPAPLALTLTLTPT